MNCQQVLEKWVEFGPAETVDSLAHQSAWKGQACMKDRLIRPWNRLNRQTILPFNLHQMLLIPVIAHDPKATTGKRGSDLFWPHFPKRFPLPGFWEWNVLPLRMECSNTGTCGAPDACEGATGRCGRNFILRLPRQQTWPFHTTQGSITSMHAQTLLSLEFGSDGVLHTSVDIC